MEVGRSHRRALSHDRLRCCRLTCRDGEGVGGGGRGEGPRLQELLQRTARVEEGMSEVAREEDGAGEAGHPVPGAEGGEEGGTQRGPGWSRARLAGWLSG